jgi:hypothetical protein
MNSFVDVGYYANATYIIVENIDALSGVGILGRQDGTNFTTSYIALRNSEIHSSYGVGVTSWTQNKVHDVVFYNNIIHDNGEWDPAVATGDEDHHGIGVGGNSYNVWVLDNEMYHNSGDGIQINTGGGWESGLGTGHDFYVGRNVSHNNKQTGFWTKQATNVIFSQNTAYGHRVSSSSMGAGMGFQYGPENVWFLYNHIYDNEDGIGVYSNSVTNPGQNSYFIGNVIHNCHSASGSYAVTDGWSPAAMRLVGGVNRHVIANTIYDVDAGINSPGGGSFEIVNNIIANPTVPRGNEVLLADNSASRSVLKNNLFYRGGQPLSIRWGGPSPAYDLAAFQAAFPGKGDGSIKADPLFVDPANGDFRLQAASPAIDAGLASQVYDTFQALYGLDIRVDFSGTPRPQDGNGVNGAQYDIGAYEFVSGGNLAPRANLTAVLRTGDPQTVDLSASGSFDADGTIVRYDWDFGDGQTVSNGPATLSHTYAAPGRYVVSLTVTDDGTPGLTGTTTVSVGVGAPALAATPASLDFGQTDTTLTFTIQNSGAGTLDYTIQVPGADTWLTVSPASGTATTETDTITVSVNRSGLSTGTHTSTITIDGGAGGTQTVGVALTVVQPGQQTTLLDTAGPWRYQEGNFTPSATWYTTWHSLGFNDAAWPVGATPIGYSIDNDVTYATPLADMYENYVTFYVRGAFQVSDPATVASLELEAGYDDGFVAYINGVEVARANMGAPGSAVFVNTEASDMHEETQTPTERFAIPMTSGLLRQGENVLAIEVHNVWAESSDAGLVARLNATLVDPPPHVVGVVLNGRPGRSVSAIEPSGIGVRTIQVTFSEPVTFTPAAVVVQTVTFVANTEMVTGALTPTSLTGSGIGTMTIAFDTASVVDTWVKVTVRGDGTLRDAAGQALDGEPRQGGGGRAYIYSETLDLPSGDGQPGGDAVFYVGSLRGDFAGGPGGTPDLAITDADVDGFLAAFGAGDPAADFRGVGIGAIAPDGRVTPADVDGFLCLYDAAVAEGRGLVALPTVVSQATALAQPLAASTDPLVLSAFLTSGVAAAPAAPSIPASAETASVVTSATLAPEVDVLASAPAMRADSEGHYTPGLTVRAYPALSDRPPGQHRHLCRHQGAAKEVGLTDLFLRDETFS